MPLVVRPYTLADWSGLLAIQQACFPPPFDPALWWQPEQIRAHIATFPAGALCAELDPGDGPSRLVGSATALIIRFDPHHPQHTWAEVSGSGWLTTHDPAGDTLYGIDVAVVPEQRGRGVARALYQERFALVRRLGLRRFLAGSRLSGWRSQQAHGAMDHRTYAEAVIAGRLSDPVITPQLRSGLRPVGVISGYLPDEESGDAALLMEWRNPEVAS